MVSISSLEMSGFAATCHCRIAVSNPSRSENFTVV